MNIDLVKQHCVRIRLEDALVDLLGRLKSIIDNDIDWGRLTLTSCIWRVVTRVALPNKANPLSAGRRRHTTTTVVVLLP